MWPISGCCQKRSKMRQNSKLCLHNASKCAHFPSEWPELRQKGSESVLRALSGQSAYAVGMNRAARERLVAVLSVHDTSSPHSNLSTKLPCFCRAHADRTIRDIEAAGFEIKDVKPKVGEIKVNIHIDNSPSFCPNCGYPVPS